MSSVSTSGFSEEALRPLVEKLVSEAVAKFVRVEEELKSLREVQLSMLREMNARFEALQREMDKRFEAIDKRFEVLEKRFNFIQWFMGLGFTILVVLMTLFRFLH